MLISRSVSLALISLLSRPNCYRWLNGSITMWLLAWDMNDNCGPHVWGLWASTWNRDLTFLKSICAVHSSHFHLKATVFTSLSCKTQKGVSWNTWKTQGIPVEETVCIDPQPHSALSKYWVGFFGEGTMWNLLTSPWVPSVARALPCWQLVHVRTRFGSSSQLCNLLSSRLLSRSPCSHFLGDHVCQDMSPFWISEMRRAPAEKLFLFTVLCLKKTVSTSLRPESA